MTNDKMRPKFLPGNCVRIASGEIPATVMSVELWAEGFWRYQVVWWIDGNRHCATLDEWEIEQRQRPLRGGIAG